MSGCERCWVGDFRKKPECSSGVPALSRWTCEYSHGIFKGAKSTQGAFFSLLSFTLWNAWGILRQVQQIIGHDRKHFLNGSDATIVKLSRTSKCGIVFSKSAPPFFHTLLCCCDICCSHRRQRVSFPHYSLLILFLAARSSLFTHGGHECMKKRLLLHWLHL